MACTRSGRPVGHSCGRTPHVPQNDRAPHAFRGPLRAPLHARETRSTVCAERTAGLGLACGLPPFRLDRISRACGSGRRGVAAPAGAGCGAGGCGLCCPCPMPLPTVASRRPFVARSPPNDCALGACRIHGTDRPRTVRVVTSELPRQPAPMHRRPRSLPSPSPKLWRTSPWPAKPQGPLAPDALFHPVPAGCGFSSALALRTCGPGAFAPRATNSGSAAASTRPPQRQAGRARGGSESRNPVY